MRLVRSESFPEGSGRVVFAGGGAGDGVKGVVGVIFNLLKDL